jgi:hypothetical protein
MRTRFQDVFAAIAIAVLLLPALGQTPPARVVSRTRLKPVPQPQAPFTAELKVTDVRTLANGSTLTRESTEVRAADSLGRVMTAITRVPPNDDGRTTTTVNVVDPLAGTRTNWMVPGEQATVTKMQSPGAGGSSCSGNSPITPVTRSSTATQRTSVTEDLGTETIQGVQAHGQRTTTTTPAGMIGNSETLVRTSEVWQAIGIQPMVLVVREISDDPDSGKRTKELVSVALSEPAPSTFLPPQGYEIVNRDAPSLPCAPGQRVPSPAPPSQ